MRRQVYHTLNNTADLTALVGDRIYPQRVPKSDGYPYVYFDVTGRLDNYDQSGNDGYKQKTFDVTCAGVTLASCEAVGDEVFTALNIKNTQIGDTGDKIEVDSIKLDGESDNFFLFDGSEDGVREITYTWTIYYR
jgi:hypothetical protein